MELRIDRNELLRGLARVQSIIERRTNMPILSTVLLKASGKSIDLSATDLEIGYQQRLPADVSSEGSLAISGRKLFEILKESKGDTFSLKEKENHWVSMSDGVATFDLACMPADEFPVLVEPEGVSTIELEGSLLTEMISKTIYAVTLEEVGFKLSGVLTQKREQDGETWLRMVATDGHRLSLIDKQVKGVDLLEVGQGVMIPKKAMTELSKFCSDGGMIRLGFRHNNCVAKKENSLLIIRLLESKFPDYSSVIPKQVEFKVVVNRFTLLDAMRKMLILSDERSRAVRIALENNGMELLSTNPDLGEARETVGVKYEGQRLEVGFNARYFVDVLVSMESEDVELGFVDHSKPCVLSGNVDQGFLGLIMPMRL
jgi:DNA polymerase-3 subunit beta